LNQRGQSLVLSLLFLTVLIGMATVVIDVGSWYRADRKLQANADASALAGAQELPESTASAQSAALAYADENDGGVKGDDVTFRTTLVPNDTIQVVADRPAPGFFANLFGRSAVDVRAKAVARTGTIVGARWAAPIAVDEKHEMLQCKCFGPEYQTTLDFFKVGPGAFRLINIDSSHGGTGPTDLGAWIRTGLDATMNNNRWYYSDPGMKPNSSHVTGALDFRDETELLFPVYSSVRGSGSGFEYFVVGFAVFHITDYDIHGSKDSRLHGYFVDMLWEGIISESAGDPNFGANTVTLIE
jgi:putative Flp pilus-assembly TadE/G-like protein